MPVAFTKTLASLCMMRRKSLLGDIARFLLQGQNGFGGYRSHPSRRAFSCWTSLPPSPPWGRRAPVVPRRACRSMGSQDGGVLAAMGCGTTMPACLPSAPELTQRQTDHPERFFPLGALRNGCMRRSGFGSWADVLPKKLSSSAVLKPVGRRRFFEPMSHDACPPSACQTGGTFHAALHSPPQPGRLTEDPQTLCVSLSHLDKLRVHVLAVHSPPPV